MKTGSCFVCGESIHEAQCQSRTLRYPTSTTDSAPVTSKLYSVPTLSRSLTLNPAGPFHLQSCQRKVNSPRPRPLLLKRQMPSEYLKSTRRLQRRDPTSRSTLAKSRQDEESVATNGSTTCSPGHFGLNNHPISIQPTALQPHCRDDTEAAGGKKPAGSTGHKA